MIDHHTMKLIPYTKNRGFPVFHPPSTPLNTNIKVYKTSSLSPEKPCAKCSNWSIYDVIFDQNQILPFICLIMFEASKPWPIWKHDMLVA